MLLLRTFLITYKGCPQIFIHCKHEFLFEILLFKRSIPHHFIMTDHNLETVLTAIAKSWIWYPVCDKISVSKTNYPNKFFKSLF